MTTGFNEEKLISRFSGMDTAPGVLTGIGDDCAVLTASARGKLLVTTDTLVEGIHFDLAWHPPRLLGRKALAVNLSDIAAMGGIPRYALLSLSVSRSTPRTVVDELAAGLREALTEYGVALVGGNSTASPGPLVISMTLMGAPPSSGQPILRSGAHPGDILWVSGTVGNAHLALKAQLTGRGNEISPNLKIALLDPKPRVELGRRIGEAGAASAGLDLSDGLLTDLPRLALASGVRIQVEVDRLPLSDDYREAVENEKDKFGPALAGGEDYEILVTAPDDQKSAELLGDELGMTVIGRVLDGLVGQKGREGRAAQGAPEDRGIVEYIYTDGTPYDFEATGSTPFEHFR